MLPTSNFGFLGEHDPQLVQLGALAERYFRDDPGTAIFKLRRERVVASEDAASRARREGEEHARVRESVEQRLAREAEERAIWERLAAESESKAAEIAARLASLQAAAEQAPRTESLELVQ